MEMFSCVLPRNNRTVLVECSVPNEQVGRVLAYMFENYLDADEFGINLSNSREEIIRSDFQYKVNRPASSLTNKRFYVKVSLKVQSETTTTTVSEAETFTFMPLCTLYPSTITERNFLSDVLSFNKRYTVDTGRLSETSV